MCTRDINAEFLLLFSPNTSSRTLRKILLIEIYEKYSVSTLCTANIKKNLYTKISEHSIKVRLDYEKLKITWIMQVKWT